MLRITLFTMLFYIYTVFSRGKQHCISKPFLCVSCVRSLCVVVLLVTLTLFVVQTVSVFFFFYLFRVRCLYWWSNLANRLTLCICNNLTCTVMFCCILFNVNLHYNFCQSRMLHYYIKCYIWSSLSFNKWRKFANPFSFTKSYLGFEFQFRCFSYWCTWKHFLLFTFWTHICVLWRLNPSSCSKWLRAVELPSTVFCVCRDQCTGDVFAF